VHWGLGRPVSTLQLHIVVDGTGDAAARRDRHRLDEPGIGISEAGEERGAGKETYHVVRRSLRAQCQ
jgi:hypothetical protein